MPLNLLVPSLLRVNIASTSQSASNTTPHPLHALLELLLLTVRSSSNKYRVELPKILSDGGGAGEIEEAMMWYAQSYEKTGSIEEDDRACREGEVAWLERLERRE